MVMAMTDTATPSTLPLTPGRWTLDPNHSRVGFAVRHIGVSKVRGHFGEFDAELHVGESAADTVVTAEIKVGSLDTGNTDRDTHVLSADLLDVSKRPTLAFRSTGITGSGSDWKLTGDLTVGGVTAPVTLDVELGGIETFAADGSRHAGFEATGEVRRKDLGVRFGPMAEAGLGDVIKLELDLQFVEPTGA
jgi:polyisoprenoid-binding protein YceI